MNITIACISLAILSVCSAIGGIALIIITLLEEKKMNWIYTADELPEKEDTYLVTMVNSWCKSRRPFIGLVEWYPEEEEWDLHDYYYGYGEVQVIAWMPTPEPAKEV